MTQEFLQGLRDSRQGAMETWAREGYVGGSAEETAQCNATALGGIRVLDQAIEQIESLAQLPDETGIQRVM